MTHEQIHFLLKDLCARLPYGVKVKGKIPINQNETKEIVGKVTSVHYNIDIVQVEGIDVIVGYSPHFEIKPYLFPLSSMTKEQHKEFYDKYCWSDGGDGFEIDSCSHNYALEKLNWCLKNHFDIYGLIPMGLAEDATNKNIY